MIKIALIVIISMIFISCNNDRIGMVINKTVVDPYYEEREECDVDVWIGDICIPGDCKTINVYHDSTYFISISDDPHVNLEVSKYDYDRCDGGDSIIVINNKIYIFK